MGPTFFSFFFSLHLSLYHDRQGRILWPRTFISSIAYVFIKHQGKIEIATIQYVHTWLFLDTYVPRLRFPET